MQRLLITDKSLSCLIRAAVSIILRLSYIRTRARICTHTRRKRTRLPHLPFLCSNVAGAFSIFSRGVKCRPESHSSPGNGANSGQRIALLTGSLDGRRDFQCLRWNAKSSYGQRHRRRRRCRCDKRHRRCAEAIYGYYVS